MEVSHQLGQVASGIAVGKDARDRGKRACPIGAGCNIECAESRADCALADTKRGEHFALGLRARGAKAQAGLCDQHLDALKGQRGQQVHVQARISRQVAQSIKRDLPTRHHTA